MCVAKDQEEGNDQAGGSSESLPFKIRNAQKSIRITGVNMRGVTAEACQGGDTVEIITRASLLSTHSFFHRVAPGLVHAIENFAKQSGHSVDVQNANNFLMIVHRDDTADLWLDGVAVVAQVRLKKPVTAMTAIFRDDIADITEIWFPDVDISDDDRIVYLFRVGFRFGLVFDLRVDEPLDIPRTKREIARLERQMSYADLYSMISTKELFSKMVAAGWFPFIEIMVSEFESISTLIESGFSLEDAESRLFDKFDGQRIDRIFERWMTKPYFRDREEILKAGLNCYRNHQWIACLKVMITEIEGIISDIYRHKTGSSTRNTDKLLDFVVKMAVEYAGGEDTLFFPIGFGTYLKDYTFADSEKRTASRHAIGHGRATSADYTQARALQCILTIDQIAFYS